MNKLRKHASRATQPGPWQAIEDSDGRWRIVDAHGMWVCDVGHDPHQARFIAAAYPEAVVALLERLRDVTAARDELVNIAMNYVPSRVAQRVDILRKVAP